MAGSNVRNGGRKRQIKNEEDKSLRERERGARWGFGGFGDARGEQAAGGQELGLGIGCFGWVAFTALKRVEIQEV